MQKLLKGGILVTDEGTFQGNILIEGEKIARIGKFDVEELDTDCEVIDVMGKLIMPGIVDAHTHYQLKSRNTITADDFVSGSISAACGGVTTFIDYADHLPDHSLKEAAQLRIDEALGKTVLDFTLHQTITHFDETISQEMVDLVKMGISSIKIFTTYRREGYMIPTGQWEYVFRRLKELEILLTVHAEDDDIIMRLEEEFKKRGQLSPDMHPKIRPSKAEEIAIEKVGELARKVGIPIYIAHLSSKAGYEALKRVKQRGGAIYAETTPHYLLLDEGSLKEPMAQRFIMTPPLRTKKDQKALWEGLKAGDIQVVATDHCSFTLEQKLSDDCCLTILPGLPGSETLLPLIHHFGVGQGLLEYPQLVRILSSEPAKIFGLYPEKGSLKPGTDADLVVFDPKKKVTLTHSNLHSKADYTPYEGMEVQGYPVMTFLRGELVVRNGEFCGQIGQGRFIKAKRSKLYKKVV
ncbi:dihydropyrimidinase [Anoxybacter fermentans]|uniref:Dihydropyrimidinase n=1 Tax=Anoxybacter fermentans TaxID=1323375 RepID=A0A3S9SWF6_9FIRM|nr:dihydropyrimidinase [Anoxybacter fermentans]AZR72582.1 dihydropyrimidinase [Anoxybacter fermentans]